jgi:nucleotide-binding universal stress UspA family protein
MEDTDILCTSDLSAASATALFHAGTIADRANSRVSLLHVLHSDDDEETTTAKAVLHGQIAQAGTNRASVLLVKGDAMNVIAAESAKGHALVVLGTHGLRGLRQKLFGADILKLVRRLAVPSFVVQEATPRPSTWGPIVMPVAAHEDISRLLDAVIALARLFATEVHVYQLMRAGEGASDELLNNKRQMLERLDAGGVRHLEVNEPSSSPSISFAGPTLEYAARVGAACVAIMAHASREYRYLADAEKERLLTNPQHIPVLCA